MAPEDLYEGPFVVACDGPVCDRSTLMELGAPGPAHWLDLSSWDGASAIGLGYFCSFDCMQDALRDLIEAYGERFGRSE